MNEIDKKGWKKVTFGDVCKNMNIAVADPKGVGIERYVGLEHLEPERLHIKTWGYVADGTTFTKTFKAGQVLFGKRRAYQKKAAIADFSGVCSGDILVLEANEKHIDPKLLPFLVSSDRFFEYAVQTSAGSLSPRTKFQDLAKFEFPLPPKDQQAKLAELLWAADNLLQQQTSLRENLAAVKVAYFEGETRSTANGGRLMRLDEIVLPSKGSIKIGPFGTQLNKSHMKTNGYKVYGQENVYHLNMELGSRYIDEAHFRQLKSCELLPGDFVITRMGTIGKSMIVPNDIKQGIIDFHLMRIRLNENIISPQYFKLLLQSQAVVSQLKKNAVGGIMDGLSSEIIRKIEFSVPASDIQNRIVSMCHKIDGSASNLDSDIDRISKIKSTLISQIFSK